ncbi:DUF1990 family protein [Streptomyces sp. NPDC058052]|uniref:DUF1990 family protein n=1 Tax=Streptomyces sp. NPDC058052 TaxID=3346316 RepID=UPI0036E12A8F
MTRILGDLTPRRRTLTYREAGATRTPDALPAGYHHLRHSTPVGHGPADFRAAAEAVTTWRMHRATGARIRSAAGRAAPGVTVEVALGIGPLAYAVPCEVIWVPEGEHRAGFAYGTLTGHPECGEESFLVELEPDGTVRFTVTAFSRPATWYTRLAGPLVPRLQLAYARRLGRALARIAAG